MFLLEELEGGVIHYSKQAVTPHIAFPSMKWYFKNKKIVM